MVLRVEVVDKEADPAGAEHDDGADNLADDADRLLEDVDDGEDRQDESDEIDFGQDFGTPKKSKASSANDDYSHLRLLRHFLQNPLG